MLVKHVFAGPRARLTLLGSRSRGYIEDVSTVHLVCRLLVESERDRVY
jgi:hypothetical protein